MGELVKKARKALGLPEAGERPEHILSQSSEGTSPADALLYDLQPPKL